MPVRPMLPILGVAGALLVATGCGRGFEYEGGKGGGPTGPVEVEECGADIDTSAGMNIAGTVVNLETGEPVVTLDGEAPLCVKAIDPTPAVTGGDPIEIAGSTICADGTYIIAGLQEVPLIGVMVQVEDCNDEGTVMRTVTGISTDDFNGMGAGDTLEGIVAHAVTADYREVLSADMGYTGDLNEDGFLAGFVVDSAEQPLDGATVSCGACADTPTFYADADPTDGLFGTSSSFNAATEAGGNSLFIIPAALITTYTCDDGGTHAWDGQLFGSLSGYGVFIRFVAS
jgi:hypothetical protein